MSSCERVLHLLHLVCFLSRHLSDLLLGIALLYQDVTWLLVGMLYFDVAVMAGSQIIFFESISGMLNMTLSVCQLFKIIIFIIVRLYPTLFDCTPYVFKSAGYKKIFLARFARQFLKCTHISKTAAPLVVAPSAVGVRGLYLDLGNSWNFACKTFILVPNFTLTHQIWCTRLVQGQADTAWPANNFFLEV